MVGALFLCGKDENLQPPKKAEINEKPLSAVGSRGRRVRGMPACRSISMPRRTRAPARSRVKSDIGIRQKRAKPRSCEAEMHQQGTSKTRSSDEGTLSGVSAGSCCPHHVAARRILKQLEFAQAVFFCACVFSSRKTRYATFAGALKLSHKTRFAIFAGALKLSRKTRFAIFAGALKHERHGWRSFFVRQGRGATAFTPSVTVSALSRTP